MINDIYIMYRMDEVYKVRAKTVAEHFANYYVKIGNDSVYERFYESIVENYDELVSWMKDRMCFSELKAEKCRVKYPYFNYDETDYECFRSIKEVIADVTYECEHD